MQAGPRQARRKWACAAVVGALGASGLAWAQELRPESLRLYGGTYSSDCGNPTAPRMLVRADALVIEQGARRKVGRGVMDSYSSFGAAPTSPVPPGYVVEFISDAFSLYVFQDRDGYYIDPAGHVPEAETVIGKANMTVAFRRCTH